MLDWRAFPLWVEQEGGGVDNPDPHTLVSSPLADELDQWSLDYDAYWDPEDPRGPVFPDDGAETALYARGRALADRVAAEVGDRWAVRFRQADGDWVQLS